MAGIYDEVFSWIDMARDRGWYSPHTARQIKTAVRRTQDAIGDKKFSDLNDLMRALPSLFNSWQRARKGSASTARSYESRMRSLIREFLKWQSAPDAYTAARDAKMKGGPAKRGAKRKAAAAPATPRRRGPDKAPRRSRKRAAAAAATATVAVAPAPAPPAPTAPATSSGISGSGQSRIVSLENIHVELRWSGAVSAGELAAVLAALAACRPEAGAALLRAAAETF